MRCKYCHNVDTWTMCSKDERSSDELINQAQRYSSYWGEDGGITVSGGEPLLQIDFLLEFFKAAKKRGFNTCIDTSAHPFSRKEPFITKFDELVNLTDLFMVDMKHFDDEAHVELTGQHNENIKDCFKYLNENNKRVWLRHVLVPGITDSEENIANIGKFIASLPNIEKVEVLPYHTLGIYKWNELGIKYELGDVEPPSEDKVKEVREFLDQQIQNS